MDIDIGFAYESNNPVNAPAVTDPDTRVDSVAATETGITWRPTGSTPTPSSAGLCITDVMLFAVGDTAKATRLRPRCFSGNGTANADGSFTLTFDGSVSVEDELQLTYTIQFTDTIRRSEGVTLSWDPTIKIKPRSGTAPPDEL